VDHVVRIIVAIPGVLLLVSGLGWVVNPESAAAGLGMPLLDGLGRSTQVGDFGAFFLSGSVLIALGVIRKEAPWLVAAALLVGLAAIVRTLAWALHGADFAAQFIGFEVVMAAILLFGASRYRAKG